MEQNIGGMVIRIFGEYQRIIFCGYYVDSRNLSVSRNLGVDLNYLVGVYRFMSDERRCLVFYVRVFFKVSISMCCLEDRCGVMVVCSSKGDEMDTVDIYLFDILLIGQNAC
eukprot:TRINITY_DN28169_c0_g1_i1.p3 TRINITY_DN28169_c0_g1~~TRINITY_DN28169_c0_g1_i1.p3  ORF type:complete len:111 (+),score=9.11 TRINITY_DN28169_c0_g1_i1:122-454(+)